ncbi:MAG: hypothetical protein ABI193_09205, partial [Minicystis sp.]
MKRASSSNSRWIALFPATLLLLAPSRGEATSPTTTTVPTPPPPPPAEVRVNAAPRWTEGASQYLQAKTGVPVRVELIAVDRDLDPLTYRITGQPKEATFVTHEGRGGSTFAWTPSADDIGTIKVTITASDGNAEAEHTLVIHVDEDWSGFFMPGAKYSTYLPAAVGKWGFFQGVSAEIRAYSWIHKNPTPGPSHGSIYLDLDLLASTRANVANAFHLSTGVELSFEANPSRRYLLPVFGLEVGAFFQRQVLSTVGEVSPTAGLYLWASPHLIVDVRAGYMLPLSAATFDDLRGLRAKL